MEAALRDLREETRLRLLGAESLLDHEGATQFHKVVWVRVRGNVRLQRKELVGYKAGEIQVVGGQGAGIHAPLGTDDSRQVQARPPLTHICGGHSFGHHRLPHGYQLTD